VETLKINSTILQSWRIVKTPPLSGEDNMRYDVDLLNGIEQGYLRPTLRFFRFKDPTVTFGRLQKQKDIVSFVPDGWVSVQRPTGGGIVFHRDDLCLSLCWRQERLSPQHPLTHYYECIHRVIRQALSDLADISMAARTQAKNEAQPFSISRCFESPVHHDLLLGDRKVVGGALYRRKTAILYQGSIQSIPLRNLELHLSNAFSRQPVFQ
jgi:lipoate-protein ligase A